MTSQARSKAQHFISYVSSRNISWWHLCQIWNWEKPWRIADAHKLCCGLCGDHWSCRQPCLWKQKQKSFLHSNVLFGTTTTKLCLIEKWKSLIEDFKGLTLLIRQKSMEPRNWLIVIKGYQSQVKSKIYINTVKYLKQMKYNYALCGKQGVNKEMREGMPKLLTVTFFALRC